MSRRSTTPDSIGRRSPVFHQVIVGGLSLRAALWPGDPQRVPILLFNGLGGNLEMLAPLVDALGDVPVVSFDIPGVGGSPIPGSFYRLPAMARLAVKVIRHFDFHTVDVIGVSWGGALAQQFAYSAPNQCRRLVLCATSTGSMLAWPAAPATLITLLTPSRFLRRSRMERDAGSLYGGRFRWDQKLVKEHAARMKRPSRLGYFMQLSAISGWTSALWLWRLRQPTLVLAGSDDPIMPLVNARVLARLIPQARLEILDDGHLFVIGQPELSARHIRDFLDAEQPESGALSLRHAAVKGNSNRKQNMGKN